ncbi:1-acyl-sn-glycerol-3-phosphate acyltransferase [Deinococcus sp. HSC-46F16]|uniref:lysophospholipid acyltransferase family protein n=1 Tax=Deinococcus sp. HSC-46F16 TaxID=2910968 RepID=UPI00209FCFA9|nr:lysophospholipid acyltransferase family protein [Deinococcus sp. HSC-46F16]MCP2015337.1 1-acyl-sn-glycerol-3-phosphate acyltransferase [Deinococcus sp. HSC-46F16]
MTPDPVGAMLRASIRRSVRTGLGGVWLRGPLPAGGAVLAPNHHSWWDGYVMGELTWELDGDFRVLMTSRQLVHYPFLRRVGALGADELRAAVRAARAGAWVVVFPEGALQPAGPPRELRPGAGWIARQAGVPLVPVALRVGLRGRPRPEAHLRFGTPTTAGGLAGALARELAALDADLAAGDPERPLAGYLHVSGAPLPDPARPGLASRLLARLTEGR